MMHKLSEFYNDIIDEPGRYFRMLLALSFYVLSAIISFNHVADWFGAHGQDGWRAPAIAAATEGSAFYILLAARAREKSWGVDLIGLTLLSFGIQVWANIRTAEGLEGYVALAAPVITALLTFGALANNAEAGAAAREAKRVKLEKDAEKARKAAEKADERREAKTDKVLEGATPRPVLVAAAEEPPRMTPAQATEWTRSYLAESGALPKVSEIEAASGLSHSSAGRVRQAAEKAAKESAA